MEKIVYVVGGGRHYHRPFAKFGEYMDRFEVISGTYHQVRDKISLVLFTGGSDVDPRLYGEKQGSFTSIHPERDSLEAKAFLVARQFNLPMVGVCRGAQFLCVMSGGKLVQHVTNHGQSHDCTLWDRRIIEVSSAHHQMQIPPKDANVIGWSTDRRSKCYLNGEDQNITMEKEIEIVHYPMTNSLGMQHHPEMQFYPDEGFKIAAELVETFLMR